jgi:hypothetical protein
MESGSAHQETRSNEIVDHVCGSGSSSNSDTSSGSVPTMDPEIPGAKIVGCTTLEGYWDTRIQVPDRIRVGSGSIGHSGSSESTSDHSCASYHDPDTASVSAAEEVGVWSEAIPSRLKNTGKQTTKKKVDLKKEAERSPRNTGDSRTQSGCTVPKHQRLKTTSADQIHRAALARDSFAQSTLSAGIYEPLVWGHAIGLLEAATFEDSHTAFRFIVETLLMHTARSVYTNSYILPWGSMGRGKSRDPTPIRIRAGPSESISVFSRRDIVPDMDSSFLGNRDPSSEDVFRTRIGTQNHIAGDDLVERAEFGYGAFCGGLPLVVLPVFADSASEFHGGPTTDTCELPDDNPEALNYSYASRPPEVHAGTQRFVSEILIRTDLAPSIRDSAPDGTATGIFPVSAINPTLFTDVRVFRAPESRNYAYLIPKDQFSVDVIAVVSPPIRDPATAEDSVRIDERIEVKKAIMHSRAKSVFRAAAFRHSTFVVYPVDINEILSFEGMVLPDGDTEPNALHSDELVLRCGRFASTIVRIALTEALRFGGMFGGIIFAPINIKNRGPAGSWLYRAKIDDHTFYQIERVVREAIVSEIGIVYEDRCKPARLLSHKSGGATRAQKRNARRRGTGAGDTNLFIRASLFDIGSIRAPTATTTPTTTT